MERRIKEVEDNFNQKLQELKENIKELQKDNTEMKQRLDKIEKLQKENEERSQSKRSGIFNEKEETNELGKEENNGKGMSDENQILNENREGEYNGKGIADENQISNENGEREYAGKGIADENKISNENGEGENICKEMSDINQKSNENGEGGKGIHDHRKMKKLEGEICASVEKGNYLAEKEKNEDNTKKFLGKKRNLNENDVHGEENNGTKKKC